MGIEIAGTGASLPEDAWSNQRLIDAYGLESTPEDIVRLSGIETRHIVDSEEENPNLWLAVNAGRMALQNAGDRLQYPIGGIIQATTTPDKQVPAVSAGVNRELGLYPAAACDINAACAGFTYGTNDGYRRIACGDENANLIIGADVLSRITDFKDRSTGILFGDGAGAVVLQKTDRQEAGLLARHEITDGRLESILDCLYQEEMENGEVRDGKIRMNGKRVFAEAIKIMPEVGEKAMQGAMGDLIDKAEIKPEDIDHVIPHQANIRIIQTSAKKMNIPMEKMVWTGNRHANTSSASIPLALHESIENGRIQQGDTILLAGFGAGMTGASSLIRC